MSDSVVAIADAMSYTPSLLAPSWSSSKAIKEVEECVVHPRCWESPCSS